MPRTPLNDVRLEGSTAVLILRDRRGNVTGECRIDAADLPRVQAAGCGWRLTPSGKDVKYVGYGRLVDGKYRLTLLHRFLMDAPQGLYVDHINGDPLDNRRANLRLATPGENNRNARGQKGGTSQYKGVFWCRRSRRWRALLRVAGRSVYLGVHLDERSAALAYDAGARIHHGAFARLNFPDAAPRPAVLTLTAQLARPA